MKLKIIIALLILVSISGIAATIFFSNKKAKYADTGPSVFQELVEKKETRVFPKILSTEPAKTRTSPTFRVNPTPTSPSKAPTSPSGTSPSPAVPSTNDKPDIEMLTSKIKNLTLSKDKAVYINARVTDEIGGVKKVELYLDDDKISSIDGKYNYGESKKSSYDDKTASSATDKAFTYIKDKYGETTQNLEYVYRKYYIFNTENTGCSIKEGYLIIIQGQKSLYEVRVKNDLKDLEVCRKPDSLEVDDIYYFYYKGGSGTYKYHIKAYDTYGYTKESTTEQFILK